MSNFSLIPTGKVSNVEIKTWFDITSIDPNDERLGKYISTVRQVDTYFVCPNGKLKLREEEEIVMIKNDTDIASCIRTDGQRTNRLIHYKREESDGPRESDIYIVPVEEAEKEQYKTLLTRAYGISVIVKKTRKIYIRDGRTRIHIDTVDGLGTFLEIEVVLCEGESIESGMTEAQAVIVSLDINSTGTLIPGSYHDLVRDMANSI